MKIVGIVSKELDCFLLYSSLSLPSTHLDTYDTGMERSVKLFFESLDWIRWIPVVWETR